MDELRELHRRLGGLLADPHPDLFTWREMLSNILLEMADYAGYGMVSNRIRSGNLQETPDAKAGA